MKHLIWLAPFVLLAACTSVPDHAQPVHSPFVSIVTVQHGADRADLHQQEDPFDTVRHLLLRLLLESDSPTLVQHPPRTNGLILRFASAESYYLRLIPDSRRVLIETLEVHWSQNSRAEIYVNDSIRLIAPDGSSDADLLQQWGMHTLNRGL